MPGQADRYGPLGQSERIVELDVLRGAALFGVLVVNLMTLAGAGSMATREQLEALPLSDADRVVRAVVNWLVYDKANTMFAFLFGLGFWLQMERINRRGAGFAPIYLRRLAVLLVFGILHAVLVFNLDILHLYALCGFILFALHGVSGRTLLTAGLVLAVVGRMHFEVGAPDPGDPIRSFSDDVSVLKRQAMSQAGDYLALVQHFAEQKWYGYILNGGIVGGVLYVLGRFLLGAWVGRRGWLQNASANIRGLRAWMWILLPLGLAGEATSQALHGLQSLNLIARSGLVETAASAIHLVSTPILAAGYVAALVVALQSTTWRAMLSPFACVGRMALTHYVMQSLIIGFVLFGVGPGLALAGKIGASLCLLIAIAAFLAQVVISRIWLARFGHGPLEWAWRKLTYGASAASMSTPATTSASP
jgi:uncharacterized protein